MLASAHSNLLGVSVVYRRGGTSATIKATLGSTTLQTQDQDGVIRETTTRDFIIPAASLAFLGANRLPEKGDEIDLTENGATTTYEARPGPNEQCYRRSDHAGTVLRVFTNQIARSA